MHNCECPHGANRSDVFQKPGLLGFSPDPYGQHAYGIECWRHCVMRISKPDARCPFLFRRRAVRTYSGRPRSSTRFSGPTAMDTSVVRRRSGRERSPSPIRRLYRLTSASTSARQLEPDAACHPLQPFHTLRAEPLAAPPMRPCSRINRRWRSRCVETVSAVLLGTALARGGTTTAVSGWRAATPS